MKDYIPPKFVQLRVGVIIFQEDLVNLYGCMIAGGKTTCITSQTMQKGLAEEAQAFLTACRTGKALVAVSSLDVTTLVTLLAVEGLARDRGETLEAPAPEMSDAGA